MHTATFVDLLESLPANQDLAFRPGSTSIGTSDPVEPFVAPELEIVDGDGLDADIILIEAPAAVGKSTLARYLSADRHIPLLDLAKVSVATGSLAGVLRDVIQPGKG